MIWIILAAALGVTTVTLLVLHFRRFAEIDRRQADISRRQAEITRQLDEANRQLTEVHVDVARELLHLRHRLNNRPLRHTNSPSPGEAAAVGDEQHNAETLPQPPLRTKRHLRLYQGGTLTAVLAASVEVLRLSWQHRRHIIGSASTAAATVTTVTALTLTPWTDNAGSQPPPIRPSAGVTIPASLTTDAPSGLSAPFTPPVASLSPSPTASLPEPGEAEVSVSASPAPSGDPSLWAVPGETAAPSSTAEPSEPQFTPPGQATPPGLGGTPPGITREPGPPATPGPPFEPPGRDATPPGRGQAAAHHP